MCWGEIGSVGTWVVRSGGCSGIVGLVIVLLACERVAGKDDVDVGLEHAKSKSCRYLRTGLGSDDLSCKAAVPAALASSQVCLVIADSRQ